MDQCWINLPNALRKNTHYTLRVKYDPWPWNTLKNQFWPIFVPLGLYERYRTQKCYSGHFCEYDLSGRKDARTPGTCFVYKCIRRTNNKIWPNMNLVGVFRDRFLLGVLVNIFRALKYLGTVGKTSLEEIIKNTTFKFAIQNTNEPCSSSWSVFYLSSTHTKLALHS